MLNLLSKEIEKCMGISVHFSNNCIDIIVFDKLSDSLFFDGSSFTQVNIEIKEFGSCEILETLNDSSINQIRKIDCNGSFKDIILFKNNCGGKLENTIQCNENHEYENIIFDFSKNNLEIKNHHEVKENGSSKLFCASVVEGKDSKFIENSLINLEKNSSCFMDNYGVAFGEGKIKINGIGQINKGASKSSNIQKATMFVMDKNSKAISEPFLFIDEDDVIASHANAVGQISEETIFYLCSRGIQKEIAKKMVVLGYFKKFIDFINSLDIKNVINKYMEEVINNV